MAQTPRRTGFWRSLRELPDRTPLRVKMTTAVLALVILALAVISFAGISYIKNYLVNRADGELQILMGSASGGPGYGGHGANSFGVRVGERALIFGITSSGRQEIPYEGYQITSTSPDVPTSPAWLVAHSDTPITVSAKSGGDRWRVLVKPAQLNIQNNNGTVTTVNGTRVAAIDISDIYATVARLALFDVLISIGIVLLLALLAAAAVRASLRPLTDIEKTAGAIAAGDLSQRVPERDPRTEVGRLGRSLNAMLAQIESAFLARARSESAAKRSEEKMRQFVGDASHELRTPLTAIRGFAEYYRQRGGVATGPDNGTPAGEIIQGTVVESSSAPGTDVAAGTAAGAGEVVRRAPGHLTGPDMDRIMRRVEQESARMGVLVEDMLLLARLDQQRPLEARPVDLLTLAADAVHDARVVAPDRSINLTVGSGRALLVIGDEVRLRQVIGNLMSNALTHTPDGTPIEVLIRPGDLNEVPLPPESDETGPEDTQPDDDTQPEVTAGSASASAASDEPAAWDTDHVPPPPPPARRVGPVESHPAAVLEVIDHGPGLTQQQAEHVFERFYRADAARTTGGTGLGLAIVAALIGAHGGATWVESTPGEGATFCIALPLSPEALHDADDDFDADADELDGDGDEQAGLTGTPSESDAETDAQADAETGIDAPSAGNEDGAAPDGGLTAMGGEPGPHNGDTGPQAWVSAEPGRSRWQV